MPEIRIRRDHALGLAKARKVAWRWAETVEEKFALECTVVEGRNGDVVEFTRPGVDGRLVVAADSFELTARLGLLVGAFSRTIEGEIENQLDALLGGAKKKPAPARKTGKAAAK